MKIRNGFVSNSSSSSFIAVCSRVPDFEINLDGLIEAFKNIDDENISLLYDCEDGLYELELDCIEEMDYITNVYIGYHNTCSDSNTVETYINVGDIIEKLKSPEISKYTDNKILLISGESAS